MSTELPSLYQISDAYLYLLECIESEEIPEEAINDTLESVKADFTDKADNIACYIKLLKYQADNLKSEINALKKRAEAKSKKADRLTEYLFNCMERADINKLETARAVLRIAKNVPAVELEDGFIDWALENDKSFLRFSEPVPDKSKIKEALKAGKILPAKMVQGVHLNIK